MTVSPKLKRRLKTIKNLNSIFSALQVITTARMQRMREKHKSALGYAAGIKRIAANLDFSKFSTGSNQGKISAILFSANRGFCGAFNQNLYYRTLSFIKEMNKEMEFIVFGKRGLDFLHLKKQPVRASFQGEDNHFNFFLELARDLLKRRNRGEISEIHIISNRYRTFVRQDAIAQRLVPLEHHPSLSFDRYLVEPEKERLSEKVFEQLLAAELYFSYLDSQLGEISSRMLTLKNAIENSKELIASLAMSLNKERQQTITRDLLEIVSSSECLKEGKCY